MRRLTVYYNEEALDSDALGSRDREHHVLPFACRTDFCGQAPELLCRCRLARTVVAVAQTDEHKLGVTGGADLHVYVLCLFFKSERLLQFYESAEGVAAVA